MMIATKARTVRWLGRMATVGAVALVLAGSAAAPAEARTREDEMYSYCFHAGGQPFTIYDVDPTGIDEVVCMYDDGYSSEQRVFSEDQ